ncbi:hypothetical protein Asppvi_008267 [Aspergillus pseudoviridinutans]|uniref:Apple domain-containing protein n=1 Tax=Aspergillus pseudoviridinutans TaxID=1517512 RepID=A0A9P3BFS4_9EURO|nr:uncharacterized protein Asppvi_008267 [Aspergillus pseudoviridinutans]GIJ89329.1 hypothetical protein Asppvi_008267 [Aspergillus pseudoviridinutans]
MAQNTQHRDNNLRNASLHPFGLVLITNVIATSHPHAQVPICHQCEEKKPAPPIPQCGHNNNRPELQSGQCATTYRCSGHCGSVAIPHLNTQTLECDYAEVPVGPDGCTIDQCYDPPECPSDCNTKSESNDVCVNDQTGCPAMDGSIRRYGGKDYIYRCNKGFCTTTVSSISNTDTLKECAEKCSRDPACRMVSHHKKTCTLATTVGTVENVPGSVVLEPVGPSPNTHDGNDCARLHQTRQTIHGSSSSFTAIHVLLTRHHAIPNRRRHMKTALRNKAHPSKETGSIALEPLPGYGCPYVDWAVKEIGGVHYEYHCNARLESGGKWTQVHVASEMECALQYSTNIHCTGISLRGQQCYLATAPIHLQPKGNWVALVPVSSHKQPKEPKKPKEDGLQVPECRVSHGQLVAYKGHTYSINCYRWIGGDGFATATKHSLADCIKMCADYANYIALHYLPSQKSCAIHDNIPGVGTQGDFGVAYLKLQGTLTLFTNKVANQILFGLMSKLAALTGKNIQIPSMPMIDNISTVNTEPSKDTPKNPAKVETKKQLNEFATKNLASFPQFSEDKIQEITSQGSHQHPGHHH